METARCGPISKRGVHVRLSCDAPSFYSTARKRAARIQLRNHRSLRMPTPLFLRKAASGRPIGRGRQEPPESLARSALSKGFARNLGELLVSFLPQFREWHPPTQTGQAAGMAELRRLVERRSISRKRYGTPKRRRPGRNGSGRTPLLVPMKVGNRHRRDPREGRRGQADVSGNGNMAVLETENHVHRTSPNS